jgi:hypothetical protein
MLPTALSQALIAFTIEFDNEFEHRIEHHTGSRSNPAGGGRRKFGARSPPRSNSDGASGSATPRSTSCAGHC